MSPPLVRAGAAHWVHPEWRGRFYPHDLPDDWMLSYYNTQFQAVYLPADAWADTPLSLWEQWLHDTRDDFVFVLEPAASAPSPPPSPRIQLATAEWSRAQVWWLDTHPDLRQLAQCIGAHAERARPLYVFSRAGDLDRLEQVQALCGVMGY